MKSRKLSKITLFFLVISGFCMFISCNDDLETEIPTDTESVSDEDSTGDAEPTGDTGSEPTDESDTATDGSSTDDSDEPTENTDTDTEPTEPTEPTDPTEPTTPVDGSDPEFEQNAAGCTMIEVPKITMGGSHADEINGYFSPAMGESAIDIIKILLMGEIKEGTYQLGAGLNDNYAQCEQCVMVWVDAALAAANEYYFQTHGTLTITEVKDVDGINRTVGRIRNLILKQVEPLNDYLGDFGFISDGKCVAAEIVEWDTTNTPGNTGD